MPNELIEFIQLRFEYVIASSPAGDCNVNKPRHIRCSRISCQFNPDVQQTARLNSWETRTVLRWPTVEDSVLSPETLASRVLLAHQLSVMPIFSSLAGTAGQQDINGFATSSW